MMISGTGAGSLTPPRGTKPLGGIEFCRAGRCCLKAGSLVSASFQPSIQQSRAHSPSSGPLGNGNDFEVPGGEWNFHGRVGPQIPEQGWRGLTQTPDQRESLAKHAGGNFLAGGRPHRGAQEIPLVFSDVDDPSLESRIGDEAIEVRKQALRLVRFPQDPTK